MLYYKYQRKEGSRLQTVLFFGVLGLYFVTAVLHVGFDWFSLPCRKVTKVLLLPLLSFAYLLLSESPSVFPLLALLFAWIGDILLLFPSRTKLFLVGAGCFALCHVCYAITFFPHGGPYRYLLLLLPILALWLSFTQTRIRPLLPQSLRTPCLLYCILLGLSGGMAIVLSVSRFTLPHLFVGLGGLCFLCSDAILLLHRYRGIPRGDFLISLTYIPAQTCLILGLCL